ncbi:MAG: hypothetical protein Q9225_004603 [Loekoesia sp. 1 TL-2023]
MVTDIEEYTLTNGAVKTAVIDDHESYATFTLTGPTTYTTIYTRALRPGRPWQAYYPDNYQCCMDCYVYFPQVEVYYWPVPESEELCANSSKPIVTAQAVLPSGAARTAAARFNTLSTNHSQPGEVSTVNAEGFTFVSPSVYVAFGDVTLGKNHYDTTLGTRAFDPKNVLCPPDFEPETLFVQQDSLAGIHTYRPRIQIPSALQNLDPKWRTCVVDDYEGIDPPRQLVPASGWGDDPVATTSKAPVQQATPAAVAPSLPKNTGNGDGSDPKNPPSNPQNDPPSSSPKPGQDPSSALTGSPPTQDSSDIDPSTIPGGANTGPNTSAGPQQQPSLKSPDKQDPADPNGSAGGQAQNGQGKNWDPTKAINGNGQSADNSQHANGPRPAQPAVVVQGQTIQQGAPPVTIGGKPVVYSKGSVYVNGVAAAAPTIESKPPPVASPEQKANPVTLGGFKFTPTVQAGTQDTAPKPVIAKPAVVIQGQTVQQGAPPVTINGHEIAYSAGSLHVGSTAVLVPQATRGQAPAPVAVQGMTFTPIAVPSDGGNQASPVNSGNQARPVAIVKGQTLTENGAPATVNGKPVVYSDGALYAAGTRVSVPTVAPGQPPSPVNIAGLSFTPQPIQSHGTGPIPAVIVAGHTLTEGAPAVSVNGAKIAYSSGSVYVNGKAAPLPTPGPQPADKTNPSIVAEGLTFYAAPPARQQNVAPAPIAAVAGHVIVQEPAGAVAIDGTILTSGGPPITISGTPVSLNPTAVVVGSNTISLPSSLNSQAIATAGGQVISQNAVGAVMVAGKTLIPGGPALTISGTRYSLASTALVAGTSTIPLPASTTNAMLTDSAGETFTIAANGGLIIRPGATISAGGPGVSISGTPFSLTTSAGSTMLIEGTRVLPLSVSITPPPLEIFSSTVTADANGDYVIGGKTVTPDGPAVTISGTTISLGHVGSAEVLVMGTTTSTVDAITSASANSTNQSSQGAGASSTTAVEPSGSAGVEGSAVATPTSGASGLTHLHGAWLWGLVILAWLLVFGSECSS